MWYSRTPQDVATFVQDAITWATANPQLRPEPAPTPPLMLIEAWNELGEGSHVVPTVGDGTTYGDALARILEHLGQDVSREYYFNDAGSQVRLLGESVQARARGTELPAGGYQGDYVATLAEEIPDADSGAVEQVASQAVALLLEKIKATLARYGVRYDLFLSERTLHAGSPSALDRAEVARAMAEEAA